MLTPTRIKTTIEPKSFESLKNGYWYYNYDINSETIYNHDSDEDEVVYNYIQIKMLGRPTYEKCVEKIIREYITASQEFDLINTANRASYSLLSEDNTEKEMTKYLEYLQKVDEIKTKVKADFNVLTQTN